jgi:hypothetical protein
MKIAQADNGNSNHQFSHKNSKRERRADTFLSVKKESSDLSRTHDQDAIVGRAFDLILRPPCGLDSINSGV